MKKISLLFLATLLFLCQFPLSGQTRSETERRKTPVMGWSSWNNFRADINEQLIEEQADAMVSSGMKAAGYEYVNVDDGFWGGRDENGQILSHPKKFPHGMKAVADYIHSKGLKAGIYSDAGLNTCASNVEWDNDTLGAGMGLFNHEKGDLRLMLKDWGYDFLKVDWCGGLWMGLDEQTRYTQIGKEIREVNPTAIFNVCRWQFPGNWVTEVADSWRISGDITNTFESILKIIDLNAHLWRYAGPGHVNDMDMLQVGRGMTYEEDKTHFSMWCMMASPLLAGNDLRMMSKETIEILTNKEMIAIDQDPFVYQARRLRKEGDYELWARPLTSTMSGEVAVALLNRSNQEKEMAFHVDSVGLMAEQGYSVRNVWEHTTEQGQTKGHRSYQVPSHGIVVLKIKGSARPYNVFQTAGKAE